MIKFNNTIIEKAIMDALDKKERGIEIDRDELINVLLKGDRDFGIKNEDTGKDYTREELQNSIYVHIVNENNKCYIGQTSRNPKDRWKRNGIEYNKKGQRFYNAIKKYTWNNISHIVICNGLTQKEVNEMEVALISLFESTNREFGYNVQNGGNGKGKHSEESIAKISEAKKGMQRSEESKKKQSEARKGKYVGEKHPMYNKHLSEEHKNKISETKKGKYVVENDPNAKKVYCNKMIFPTAKECAKFYNVNYSTMSNWLRGERKTPSEFIELELRYATTEDIEKYPLCIEESKNKIIELRNGEKHPNAKKVYCNKMIFPTVTQCSEFYNINYSTMNAWLKGINKAPSKFIEKELRFATEEDINTYPLYIKQDQ